jgi:hypothetical protein
MKKGMLVYVYRNAEFGGCTNNGLTDKVTKLILVGDGIDGPFEVKEGEPYLELVRNAYRVHAEPRNFGDMSGLIGPMFGGNFVYSSDSRFTKVCYAPLPVHDRYETQEQYDSLSR